ncbi:MAG TPA: bifunctional sugar-1-phosphate nucleotidylyltransferase/acetyltransferase [Dehalococcoidales bacterium]|nr:bifunctional sugar-1-phosphate nucleotidylyltransferase/acetyltransferase [Dehalococcoidales bacterium]
MKAVILAAGEGNRMRPLTSNRPKVMLPIANKPILEHLLIEAREAGIKEFVFVVGYGSEQVRSYFGQGEKWGVKIYYSEQRKQMGTADAIRMVSGVVDGSFLAINGDIVVNRDDIGRLLQNGRNTMSVIEVKDPRGLGIVELSEDRVVNIYEKTQKPPTLMANAGLYLFTTEIFEAIARTEKSPRGEYEITDSLKVLINTKGGLHYQEIKSRLDLSYPWDLLHGNESVLAGLEAQNLGEVEENVVLKGSVAIGKNTVIKSGTYIEGPVIIGDECRIGPNCYIRASTAIGDGCHIGAAVEVKNSIIMKGTKIPHHNYVGDSVIGEGCNLGAGTKIANLRLDKADIHIAGVNTGRRKLGAIIGDRVETGINASINVGSMIGNNTFIGPGAVVSGVIMPDSKIL